MQTKQKELGTENIIFDLHYPYHYQGQDVKALHLRRLKVRDQLALDKSKLEGTERVVALMALCSGMSEDSLHELDQSDFARLSEFIQNNFFYSD